MLKWEQQLIDEVFEEYSRYFSAMKNAGKYKKRLLRDKRFISLVESEYKKGEGNLSIELHVCMEYDLWINRMAYMVLGLLPKRCDRAYRFLAWVFKINRSDRVLELPADRLGS